MRRLGQYHTVPSKAEDEKGNAKESGHSVPDQGVGMAGAEVEAKPESSSQGKQLARQKIHLYGKDIMYYINIQQNICLSFTLKNNL